MPDLVIAFTCTAFERPWVASYRPRDELELRDRVPAEARLAGRRRVCGDLGDLLPIDVELEVPPALTAPSTHECVNDEVRPGARR